MTSSRHHFVESLESRALFAADLSASLQAILPEAAIGGEKVKAVAKVTLTNLGDEPIKGATTVDLFLSLDHTFDGSDVQVLSKPVKLGVGAGKTKTLKLKIRSFPITAAGEYHLIARVNADGVLPEASLVNNVAVDETVHVQYAPPLIDLTGAFNAVPATVRHGKTVKATVDLGNIGNLPVKGRLTFAIAASTDTTADPVGTPLAVTTAKVKVPVNDVGTAKIKFRVPSNFPAGTYFLIGTVDSTNVAAETDETNNTFPGFSAIVIE